MSPSVHGGELPNTTTSVGGVAHSRTTDLHTARPTALGADRAALMGPLATFRVTETLRSPHRNDKAQCGEVTAFAGSHVEQQRVAARRVDLVVVVRRIAAEPFGIGR